MHITKDIKQIECKKFSSKENINFVNKEIIYINKKFI